MAAGKGRKLVIVESPAKARTIEGYLGPATRSRRASATSATCRSRRAARRQEEGRSASSASTWTTASSRSTSSTPTRRRRSPSSSASSRTPTSSYLATDEDREGEAIAWHLLEVLEPQGPRQAAWSSTRSPATRSSRPSTTPASSTSDWSTPRRPAASSTASTATRSRRCCGGRSCRGLSAGRVQSVATRLVVERERERIALRTAVLLGRRGRLPRRRGSVHAAPRRRRRRARRAGP